MISPQETLIIKVVKTIDDIKKQLSSCNMLLNYAQVLAKGDDSYFDKVITESAGENRENVPGIS
jgi:hypothetical protein